MPECPGFSAPMSGVIALRGRPRFPASRSPSGGIETVKSSGMLILIRSVRPGRAVMLINPHSSSFAKHRRTCRSERWVIFARYVTEA